MRILLDTNLLLWSALDEGVPPAAHAIISAPEADLMFSAATIWEVAIKRALDRSDFDVDPRILRRGLLDNGYQELPITGLHAAKVAELPRDLHKDPFDRILVAQATSEGLVLLTADTALARYGSPVHRV